MLPTTQEYKISLMIGQDSFRTLEGVEVIPNPNYPDEPWYSTGGLAIVFKLKRKDKLYALKCFYTEANERQERLGLIAAYLKQNPSPYFVDFTYLENELWVETDNDEGQGYPVVLMEWVEGKTLDNYLEQICTQNNTPALKNLYFQFCNLAWWLQQQPIAHGDIKHDNLIVTPDEKLKLIDYDGVFVPALRGRKANEMGSPCYQHPKRDAYFFDKNLDDFSLLVIQITLLALQHQPKLFTEHYNGDGIILKDTDYQNFAQSPIKTILWQLPEVKIPLLLSQLQGNLNNSNAIDLMPLLQDVAWINWLVGGQKDGKSEFERQKLIQIIKSEKNIEVYPFLISNGLKSFDNLIRTKDEIFYVNFSTIDREYRLNIFKKYHYYIQKDSVISNNFERWKMRDTHDISSFEITFKWDENWGMLFSEMISEFYQISNLLIEKYENKWDWGKLSRNKSLLWSVELIEKFEDKWVWEELSRNKSLSWSFKLVEKYEDKWNWESLSWEGALPWSVELFEKYEDMWKWYGLSNNISLPWSIELIEEFKDKWEWSYLSKNESLPWSAELIEKYENKWNWGKLSRNKYLPWSIELIEKYENKWNWQTGILGGLNVNESLPWSIELIEKYKDKWEWGRKGMSENTGLPWTIELIEKYEDKWEWEWLSLNESLKWSLELIEKYEDKWDWGKWKISFDGDYYLTKGMSGNNSLPWSIELLEEYDDKWEWGTLSKNEFLPWSIELIEKYKGKWDWKNLSINKSLLWSVELIEKYKDKWDWYKLSGNPELPWSIELIEKYNDKWDWYKFSHNNGIYEKVIKPLLNDEFIDEIMAEI